MKVREQIKLIEDDGWVQARQRGSHRQFIHAIKGGNARCGTAPSRTEGTSTMTGYAVIIEGEDNSYSAYVPELPGCIATGKSRAEVENRIRSAIEFHLEAMREADEPIPPPTSTGTTIVEVPAAS